MCDAPSGLTCRGGTRLVWFCWTRFRRQCRCVACFGIQPQSNRRERSFFGVFGEQRRCPAHMSAENTDRGVLAAKSAGDEEVDRDRHNEAGL